MQFYYVKVKITPLPIKKVIFNEKKIPVGRNVSKVKSQNKTDFLMFDLNTEYHFWFTLGRTYANSYTAT